MIHLVPSLTLDGRFCAQDVPHELQWPLLKNMVVPRIVSSSMMPAIQEGDSLELSPPTSLTVGTIVLFRHNTELLCHRITAIDSHGTLMTRGDATEGACEAVRPDSVIGTVTGVMRDGTHISLGQRPPVLFAPPPPSSLKSRARTVVAGSITGSIRVLAKLPLFHSMSAMLVRWTATVDILTPAPFQSLPSHSKIASVILRTFQPMAGRLSGPIGQEQTRYVVRLGPWQLAQYDPATGSLLLRQSLRDAGLESLFRQILRASPTA